MFFASCLICRKHQHSINWLKTEEKCKREFSAFPEFASKRLYYVMYIAQERRRTQNISEISNVCVYVLRVKYTYTYITMNVSHWDFPITHRLMVRLQKRRKGKEYNSTIYIFYFLWRMFKANSQSHGFWRWCCNWQVA